MCIRSDADVIGMGTVGRAGRSCLLLVLVMIGGSRGGDGDDDDADVDEEGGENEEGG